MKSLNEIITYITKKQKPCVLATVVNANGHTPQTPGARMVIYIDKNTYGTVGGGCVEGDIKSESVKMLTGHIEDKVKIITADLTDPIGQKDGDICGGKMEILLEKIEP